MKPALLQPAYVLHRRDYRESSLLVEVFTQDHGRLSVIAKGARRPSRHGQGLLQPFLPLLISWSGKGELKTLTHVEVANGSAALKYLQGDCLFAGFYLNELLMYLLQKWDPHPKLYSVYADALTALQSAPFETATLRDGRSATSSGRPPQRMQKSLRIFEKRLLDEIGYGLLQTFLPDQYYRFVPEHGFVLEKTIGDSNELYIFSGRNLLAIAREDWNDESLQDAKRLTRIILAPLLGARTLYSRQLFNVYQL